MATEPTMSELVRTEVETQVLYFLLEKREARESGARVVDWVHSRVVTKKVWLGIKLHHAVVQGALKRLMREGFVERRELKHGGFEYRATEKGLLEGRKYIYRINEVEDA